LQGKKAKKEAEKAQREIYPKQYGHNGDEMGLRFEV